MTWQAAWAERERARLGNIRRDAHRKLNDPIAHWAKAARRRLVKRAGPGKAIATTGELVALATPHRCALTGWAIEPGEGSLDHITPVYDGGGHTIENLQLLHAQVNQAKGALPQQRFIAICRAVAENNPK